MKENKYDNEAFFEQYSQMSRSQEGLKGAGEWHVLRSLLPNLQNKQILDLGCGYGWHCKYAVEQGAAGVMGIDLSQKMIQKAQQINADPRIEYRVSAVEDFEYPAAQFDVVLSSLTFHYIPSFDTVCKNVFRTLRPGGSFIFSVEHPIFTAQGKQEWIRNNAGENLHWPVDNYFHEGMRHSCFLGEEVQKYHKTLTTYIDGLLTNGFSLNRLIEPQPEPELLKTIPGMQDELRRPMMLIILATK